MADLDFNELTSDASTSAPAPSKKNYKKIIIMLDDVIAETKDSVLIAHYLPKNIAFWVNKKFIFKNDFFMHWSATVTIDTEWEYSMASETAAIDKKIKGDQLLKLYDAWITQFAELLANNEKLTEHKLKCDTSEIIYIERVPTLISKYNKIRG